MNKEFFFFLNSFYILVCKALLSENGLPAQQPSFTHSSFYSHACYPWDHSHGPALKCLPLVTSILTANWEAARS